MVPTAITGWDEIVPGLYQGGHDYNPRREHGVVDDVIVCDEFHLVISLVGLGDRFGPSQGVEHIVRRIPDGVLDAGEVAAAVRLGRIAAERVGKRRRVLVRCQAGYNRSGLVVGFALMAMGHKASDAIELIRSKRGRWALSNQHFVAYLHAAEVSEDVNAER